MNDIDTDYIGRRRPLSYSGLFSVGGGTTETPSSELTKPPVMVLMFVITILLFIALLSTFVYFKCIRPRQQGIASRLTRLSSVSNS